MSDDVLRGRLAEPRFTTRDVYGAPTVDMHQQLANAAAADPVIPVAIKRLHGVTNQVCDALIRLENRTAPVYAPYPVEPMPQRGDHGMVPPPNIEVPLAADLHSAIGLLEAVVVRLDALEQAIEL